MLLVQSGNPLAKEIQWASPGEGMDAAEPENRVEAAPMKAGMSSPPVDAWKAALGPNPDAAEALQELHVNDPPATMRLAETISSLPEAGRQFLNFDLKWELGRGAFGRVFLAEQTDLSHRRVVLKISTNMFGEAKTLAQLLHTNVVPIYSIHQQDTHQAVCMPFLGGTTVADVLKAIHQQGAVPASGKMLVSTLHDRQSTVPDSRLNKPTSSSKHASDHRSHRPGFGPNLAPLSPLEHEARVALSPVASRVLLDKLEGYSYVEAVLWIASRLADGLAHAHERGIVHRDLKPANILFTDEGQPMLLDFNLAEDVKLREQASAARLGGTLPYMSPEQLAAFQGPAPLLDARTDLYSLGLILFELLGGRFPFPHHRGSTKKILGPMVKDRLGPLPSLRTLNPAVSPAVEAIVHKCLQPDPDQRYGSARKLQEDLQRQLDHRPLLHAKNPSWRERASKWMTRHPRLSSSTTVGMVAAALLFTVGLGYWWQNERLRGFAARDQFDHFQTVVTDVQFLFNGSAGDGVRADQAIAKCQEALGQYQILNNSEWRTLPQVSYLPAEQQEQLDQDAALLLLYLARAKAMQAKIPNLDPEEQNKLVEQALGCNRLAEACLTVGATPAAVLGQRADLEELAGRRQQANQLRDQATVEKKPGPFAAFLTARENVVKGRFQDALPTLQELTRADPKNVHAWFLLARCHDGLAQDEEAIRAYTATMALWPRSNQVHFNRALAFLRRGAWKSAIADFDTALSLDPDHAETLLNRALAYHGLKDFRAAEADLTAALTAGASFTRVYYLRAKVRDDLGDARGAKLDREEGLRHPPTDEVSWTTRGFVNLSNPKEALADFDKALEINPRYLPALTNKAHVLGELLNRGQDSVLVLDQILELYPDHVASRASRGVLLARLGKREQAQKDAVEALRQRDDPATQYQVAGIYALTAQAHKEDFHKAVKLLTSALRNGFGHEWLDRDTDLDPIRHSPEFRRLIEAAKTLR